MKRIAYISAMVLALVACTREPINEESGTKITIEATIAENGNLKSVIQEGTGVYWEPGDEVKLFFNGVGSRFSSECTSVAEKTTFTGTLNVSLGFNEGFSDATPLWGLYPYRGDATADNSSVTTTLPAEQAGRAGSFAKGTFITLAKSQSLKMGFYNVCGGVRFSLVNDNIKEVVFEGKNGENLAGKVKLTFDGGYPVVSNVVTGEKSITLTAPNGGCFEKGKWYYIVALPGTLSNGFKMTFNTADEYAVRSSSSSVTIKRGVFGSIEDVDQGLIFIEKGSDPAGDNIVFKDPAAKFACVAKYDTNGDGEVSYAEAEAAISFEGLFADWKSITSFDEIKYFKNVRSISGLFDGCNKLVSITIPENITNLGTNAFNGCSSLTTANIPSGVTSIPDYCFYGCSSLTSISIPSGITYIGSNAFNGVERWGLELPSSVSSLGSNCFGDKIKFVTLPATTPVSIQLNSFDGVKRIFVPANMIEMYKVMTNWSNDSGKLHPINFFKEKEEFTLGISGAVDMGTSVKWAACNLGASKPEEYGGYYQWAGLEDVTSTSIYLDWSNCPYHTGSSSSTGWTKYIPLDEPSYWSGEGVPDNKTALDPEDDVAHVKWGEPWRIPTQEEFDELTDGCFWEWTTYNGVKGCMVYSFESGNKIFLPAAGHRRYDYLSLVGSRGRYWSSSLYTNYPYFAYGLDSDFVIMFGNRYDGRSVRPVSE